MKKFIIASLTCLFICSMSVQAQSKKENFENWREKMKAEKVAFITSYVDLTVEEAQNFWPIYNEIEKKKDGLARKERQAYHKLNKAIESNNEKDIQTCLKAYIDAADDNQRDLEEDYEQLCKVLPEKKVTKLMVAEEKFRHQQIGRLRHHRGNNNARKGNQK